MSLPGAEMSEIRRWSSASGGLLFTTKQPKCEFRQPFIDSFEIQIRNFFFFNFKKVFVWRLKLQRTGLELIINESAFGHRTRRWWRAHSNYRPFNILRNLAPLWNECNLGANYETIQTVTPFSHLADNQMNELAQLVNVPRRLGWFPVLFGNCHRKPRNNHNYNLFNRR